MASKRTRSERFLWQQQRLNESSNDKHAAKMASDREHFFNHRDNAASRRKPRRSNEDIAASANFAASTTSFFLWPAIKWFLTYIVWHMATAMAGGFHSTSGKVVTSIFIVLIIIKQVRRRRKRRGY
ncbi:hypothetical protein [Pseudarthrobacter sulfonivorans]|uniref:hypothetical protein n=1 Tax=Pseudarthrobacter sulfonivorans TaxID=121292 RepID=UPI002780CDA1|nr:hypothetical protein [Pseudarthrobacter sulfonivorans]MDP9998401.1 hypothetical protein [Pseudarthrobacter sulfonivorans]